MFSKVLSMGIFAMDAYMVSVEADLSQGLPQFAVVGLPGASVSESRDRVRSAIKNSGFEFPASRITVNLAPADIKKEGSIYDLPILVSVLTAGRQLTVANLEEKAFIGELSLSGELHRINGALSMAIKAEKSGIKELYVPFDNGAECAVVEGVKVFPVKNIKELSEHLEGRSLIEPVKKSSFETLGRAESFPDFADVKGQFAAKRALEIAAAGGHNVMMIGPPGSGKSMLAKRIPSILPDMTYEESLETTMLYSIAGRLPENCSLITARPFRSPHHTISPVGLSGGGIIPRPGEISLAHNGVLFLDELPEFPKATTEVLRQPIENNEITIARASGAYTYPCSVMLVCAMNPCPCGYYGHPEKKCTCPKGTPAKYLSKVSGPLLDRLDIHIEVPPVDFQNLSDIKPAESSEAIRERVNAARKIQHERFAGTNVTCNAKMDSAQTREYCKMKPEAVEILKKAFEKLDLSARAYDKILRVARTIADLDGGGEITAAHISEAVQYRSLDRKFWR